MNLPLSGSELKSWRERTNLNQDQVAALLQISREWLGKLERGQREISADIFLRFEQLRRDPKFSSGLSTQVKTPESAEPYLSRNGPMLLNPRHSIPPPEPTKAQCLAYFQHYLESAATASGGIGHTWIELQKHFPLPKDNPEPPSASMSSQ